MKVESVLWYAENCPLCFSMYIITEKYLKINTQFIKNI